MYNENSLNKTTFSYEQTLDKRITYSRSASRNTGFKKNKTGNSFFTEKIRLEQENTNTNLNNMTEDINNNTTEENREQTDFSNKSTQLPKVIRTQKEIENITLKLYTDSKNYENKKEELRKEHFSNTCPFTPYIQDKSIPNVRNFYGRLQNWVEKRNNNTIK